MKKLLSFVAVLLLVCSPVFAQAKTSALIITNSALPYLFFELALIFRLAVWWQSQSIPPGERGPEISEAIFSHPTLLQLLTAAIGMSWLLGAVSLIACTELDTTNVAYWAPLYVSVGWMSLKAIVLLLRKKAVPWSIPLLSIAEFVTISGLAYLIDTQNTVMTVFIVSLFAMGCVVTILGLREKKKYIYPRGRNSIV